MLWPPGAAARSAPRCRGGCWRGARGSPPPPGSGTATRRTAGGRVRPPGALGPDGVTELVTVEELRQQAAEAGAAGGPAVGWQLWVGAAVGAFPWFLGAYEFGKRIVIQRQCERCAGTGLVGGEAPRKCPECGGFFPWESWQQFLTSDPGNGGPLRAPKGQTSVFYSTEVNGPKGGAAAGGGGAAGEGQEEGQEEEVRAAVLEED